MTRSSLQRALRPALLLLFLGPCSGIVASQLEVDDSRLTIDRIFCGEEFQTEDISIRWARQGSSYTRQEPSSDGENQIVRYVLDNDTPHVVVPPECLIPPGQDRPLDVDGYTFSPENAWLLIYTNAQRVWRRKTRGDYWVLDRASRVLRQLGGDAAPASLMFAKFSPTAPLVAYVRERNIYVENLLDHTVRQMTQSDSTKIINGTFDWVYEEELSLRDGFRWSPDGQRLAYWQLDTNGVPEFPLVNNTDHLYPHVRWFAYPKTGQVNPASRIGVLDIESGTTRWLKIPGDSRQHYLARLDWIDNHTLVLQQLNRRQNINRVMIADAQSGDVSTVLTERDEAWVDVHDELFWLPNKEAFTWISERDGWRHVYRIDRRSGAAQLVTPGDYDVIELLHVDSSQRCIYFLASPDNPCQKYLYRVQLDGTGLTRLTPENRHGSFHYDISPDGRSAIVTSSAADQPPRMDIVRLPDHQTVRTLTTNVELRRSFEKLKRADTEFFRVDIGNDTQLDGWCMKPPHFNPRKKYPLLIHVYGEPAGQTVLDRWGGDNYLWHLLLAQQGYVVMSFDNRGTPAPRGRSWRKCVYRKIGILAPQDQAAAVRAVLKTRPYLDPDRVGVWGWSGGGSMTLNAMFKFPDLYKTGISIAPVPNQRYYDTIYQERYMGLPSENADGYIEGSPISFASQLAGNLLLVHGTGDDNCHYQTTEKLINELIRHNKQFTMMAYPNRTHSIREGANTSRHLRQLMTDYLLDKLPAGPR